MVGDVRRMVREPGWEVDMVLWRQNSILLGAYVFTLGLENLGYEEG